MECHFASSNMDWSLFQYSFLRSDLLFWYNDLVLDSLLLDFEKTNLKHYSNDVIPNVSLPLNLKNKILKWQRGRFKRNIIYFLHENIFSWNWVICALWSKLTIGHRTPDRNIAFLDCTVFCHMLDHQLYQAIFKPKRSHLLAQAIHH